MWYFEELKLGQWRPRTSALEPSKIGPEGEKRNMRFLKEVAPEHRGMSLDALRAIYTDEPVVVPLAATEPSAIPAGKEAKASSSWDDNGWDDLIELAIERADSAMARYPQPNYVISKLAEEAGEVVKEAIHYAEGRGSPERVIDEMVDLIAMAYRLWVEGDQVHGMKPLCEELKR